MISSLSTVIDISNNSDFDIRTDLTGKELYCLVPDLPEIKIDPTTNSKHVPDIELQISVIK